jgi:hypothetical protein
MGSRVCAVADRHADADLWFVVSAVFIEKVNIAWAYESFQSTAGVVYEIVIPLHDAWFKEEKDRATTYGDD